MKKILKNKVIWQFNFSTLEQLKGIVKAAGKNPVILGTSESESKFIGLEKAVCLVQKPNLFLNLDHGKDLNYIKEAIRAGYDMVHFDGSGLTFSENVKKTKELVKYAHAKGVLVEAEIDPIGQRITNPEQANYFCEQTNIDFLAIAVGNKHGKEKVKINFEIIKKINKAFLVLHGGSGISENDLKKAIDCGIKKININTELRLAWKKALKKALTKKSIKPYDILEPVEKEIEKKVRTRLAKY